MIYTYAIAGLIALVVGFTSGWKVATWRAESNASELVAAQAHDALVRQEHASGAATQYEVAKAAQRTRTIYVTRDVERAVQGDPDCSGKPLPSSLRDALSRAAANTDQPQPDVPMRAASAP